MSDTKHTQIGRLIKKGSLAGYIDFGKIAANSPRAKLMLAAPDLLQAAKELMNELSSRFDYVEPTPEESAALCKMEAAIKKAGAQ